MRHAEDKMADINITMSIAQCEWTKHSNQTAEIVRLESRRSNHMLSIRHTLDSKTQMGENKRM